MNQARHVPVMLQRCLDLLAPALAEPGAVVVDCTLGLGGHSEALLATFPDARLVALDRDKEALRLSGERLAAIRGPRHPRARRLRRAARGPRPAGDPQGPGRALRPRCLLHAAGRGRPRLRVRPGRPARHADGPDAGVSAAEVLNTYPPGELVRILRAYGEEKQAKRIVSAVVRERVDEPFTNSARLVELIRDALPQAAKRTGGNPAKRTFQALRIEVNGELAVRREGDPRGGGDPGRRRPDRRPVVPVAGGPPGQAGLRGRRGQHRAARAAGRPRALPAPARTAHPRRRDSPRRKRSPRTAGPPPPGCGGRERIREEAS